MTCVLCILCQYPLRPITNTFNNYSTLKTNPEWSIELREEYTQVKGAYHMNKTHWNSFECVVIKMELIHEIIDHSYNLIFKSLTKKLQAEILEGQ